MPRKMIKQDERYHDTLLLLKKYRDVVWSLSVSVEHAKSDFRECFGENIDEFLESVYVAGADLSGTDIEERAKCIERSNKMLQLVDSAVATMRKKHKHGELYYQILYWLDGVHSAVVCKQVDFLLPGVILELYCRNYCDECPLHVELTDNERN